MIGAFNDIIHSFEKLDNQPNYFNSNNSLINFMNFTSSIYLDSIGSQFTWCNKRLGFDCVHKRLIHAIANPI